MICRIIVGAFVCAASWQALAAEAGAAAPTALESAQQDVEQGRFGPARQTLEKLSRTGVPAADYDLAVMHLNRQVPHASTRAALRLMTRAADHGFVTAQYGLGRLYDEGDRVRRNLALSNRWYLRAAESGSVDAQVAIATAHYLGRGTAKDSALAAHWYRQAANGGDVGAQYLLASMYETGDGLPRDLRLARYWYDVAARNGDDAAPLKVKEIDALPSADAN